MCLNQRTDHGRRCHANRLPDQVVVERRGHPHVARSRRSCPGRSRRRRRPPPARPDGCARLGPPGRPARPRPRSAPLEPCRRAPGSLAGTPPGGGHQLVSPTLLDAPGDPVRVIERGRALLVRVQEDADPPEPERLDRTHKVAMLGLGLAGEAGDERGAHGDVRGRPSESSRAAPRPGGAACASGEASPGGCAAAACRSSCRSGDARPSPRGTPASRGSGRRT